MTALFETHIVGVGPEAEAMLSEANMFILFGVDAPADLAEYCFTIDNKNLSGKIEIGGKLLVDGIAYPITAVGKLVETNLANLGHITVSLDGSGEGSLPGTLHIKAESLPQLKDGSLIQIVV